MKYIIIAFFIIMQVACITEDPQILYEYRITNNTDYDLKIYPISDTVRALPFLKIKKGELSSKSYPNEEEVNHPLTYEPLEIIYEDGKSIIHSNMKYVGQGEKSILDTGNLLNIHSYQVERPNEYHVINSYTFTEKDYLEAK